MSWFWSTRRMSELDETLYTPYPQSHTAGNRWSVATNQSFHQPTLNDIVIQPVTQPSQSWWLKSLFTRKQTECKPSELEYVTDNSMADMGQLDNDGRVRISTLDMSIEDVELNDADQYNNQQYGNQSRYGCINPFQWTGESRDYYAALIFILHVIGMLAVAIIYGQQLINSDNWQASLYQDPPACKINIDSGAVYCADLEGFNYVIILIICTVIGALWSLVWLKICQNTYTIMNLTFGLNLALYVTVSIEFIFIRLLPLGCGFIVFGILQLIYLATIKYKLPFTHAILKTNVGVLHNNPNVLHVSYVISFVALLWYSFWSFTFTATMVRTYAVTTHGPQTGILPGFILCFTLISLYWSTHVIQFSAQMITSGVIATYMLKPSESIPAQPFIRNVFRLSVFGALCSAAFCTPITEGFRQLVKQSKKIFPSLIPRWMSQLADLGFKYSNHYAITALACEPTDWTTLATGTFQLIKNNQLVAECVNRDISSTVTTFSGFVAGMLAAICAGTWSSTVGFAFQQQLTLLAFLISWCAASIILSVCQACISTTLMCWATDDAALQGNRPEITAVLNEIVQPQFSRKTSVSRSFYIDQPVDEVDKYIAKKLQPIDEINELIHSEEKTNETEQLFHHSISAQHVIPIWNQSERALRSRGLDTTHGF